MVKTLCSGQGAQVRSPVREQRSHMPKAMWPKGKHFLERGCSRPILLLMGCKVVRRGRVGWTWEQEWVIIVPLPPSGAITPQVSVLSSV